MVSTVLIAVAIVASMTASALTWGAVPGRARMVLSTSLGVVVAVLVWMVLAAAVGAPPRPANLALGVLLIALAAAVAGRGGRRLRER